MEVLVAIPCYNCETQIVRVLRELNEVLDDCPRIKKIAVIDNRSIDQTVIMASECISGLTHKDIYSVYKNEVNAGLGGTHKIAFEMAKKEGFSHLMILHGDHQASPADMPLLIKSSEENSEMTVLGSRFRDLGLLSGFSKVRIAGNLALNFFYTAFSGKKVSDLGSGLNLFRINDVNFDEAKYFDNGFTFNMDLLLYFIKRKKPFRYEPIHWSTTDQVSNVNALKVGWKTAKKLIFWKLGHQPHEQFHLGTEKIL